MNSHVHRFYRKFADEQVSARLYHEVIGLHEAPQFSWEDMVKKAPSLPKGWHELSRLSLKDRVEFTRDFWLSTLPFHPQAQDCLSSFFGRLDDVGVYLTQLRSDSSFECEIVYSLKDGSCFYHGSPPAQEVEIAQIQFECNAILPDDFLSFLKIHNGFCKYTDTGIIKTRHLPEVRRQLFEEIQLSLVGCPADPADLIPFYESFGQKRYQCFFAQWRPMGQAGNVEFSPFEMVDSNLGDPFLWQQKMAFPTFTDWLLFYLDKIE